MPFGKVWRTGADEATHPDDGQGRSISAARRFRPAVIRCSPCPTENGAKLILNKQTGQWGTKYDESQDLARIDLKKNALTAPADQFTITVEKNDGSGGELKLAWENTSYSTLFSVKK